MLELVPLFIYLTFVGVFSVPTGIINLALEEKESSKYLSNSKLSNLHGTFRRKLLSLIQGTLHDLVEHLVAHMPR